MTIQEIIAIVERTIDGADKRHNHNGDYYAISPEQLAELQKIVDEHTPQPIPPEQTK